MKNSKVALFDFDGTLTNKDSFILFIKSAVGNRNFFLGFALLLPILLIYKAGILSNHKAKSIVLKFFFRGWEIERFQKCGDYFSAQIIPEIIRKDALKKMQWHLEEKHRVILVTASPENWIKAWSDKAGIELIATKLEVVNNKITGNFQTSNCYGEEKVKRLKSYLELEQYYIYAYGDSKGDKPFLELADEKFYRVFCQ